MARVTVAGFQAARIAAPAMPSLLRPFEPGLRIDAISRSNAGRAARTGWKRASTKPSRCISSLSASSSSNAVPTPRCRPYSAAATTAAAMAPTEVPPMFRNRYLCASSRTAAG